MLVGAGPDAIAAGLEQLEARAASSVWNMQRTWALSRGTYRELTKRTQSRGLEQRLLVSLQALLQNPLLPYECPGVRIGPVSMPLLVVDGQCVVFAGDHTDEGAMTALAVTSTDLVAEAVSLWSALWDVSDAATSPADRPRLSERHVDVARGLVEGDLDRVIAARLGVSERTVSADVARLYEYLGASSRGEAASLLAGGASRTEPSTPPRTG